MITLQTRKAGTQKSIK
ncbi:unnamed protein product [Oikopleura dioica]|uniref:Uncharacterized protein n=1 Tax=Oikopleura dioica TaxID=34765 RepID=E4Y824_OIKDI|nr:unnamed protein product [Oikopleura dioica]